MANILALDQSSHVTGWAVFSHNKLSEYGKFDQEEDNIGERLYYIRQHVNELINKYDIDELVIEDIQLQGNVTNNVVTFKVLAEVFGVIYELATELKIPITAVFSSSWKNTLKIKGETRAEQKKNAQIFVQNIYGIKPIQDICDAICIGTHYLIQSKNPWD